jgi:ligand-binding sensor domain-containing protein
MARDGAAPLDVMDARYSDADFHNDVLPDDGPINGVNSWLTREDGVVWQCTCFGMARYHSLNLKAFG